MPQGEGTYGKQVGRPPKKGDKDTGYSPYKMKGSPMYRNFGVGKPPKGVTGEESPTSDSSPAKGWLKKAFGGVKKFVGGGGLVGMGVRKLAGTGKQKEATADLESRVAALEAGQGGGNEAQTAMEQAQGAAGDPAAAAAAEGGDPAAVGDAVKQARQAQNQQAVGFLSDIRAKEKIQRVGNSSSGIPIYEFNYIGSEARYSGTMAQDLLNMGIDAVSMGEDGYYRVNYNNIDVDMRLIN